MLNSCLVVWTNKQKCQILPHTHNISVFVVQVYRYTTKNTVISPKFLVWKFFGKAQFAHSFGWFARNYAETESMRKLRLSAKFSHQKIRWNYNIFCSVNHSENLKKFPVTHNVFQGFFCRVNGWGISFYFIFILNLK